ncbi:D-beta-hydroxybutyrate dehydrogenase, mitochondrial-like [Eriocheir sinensis]|uniref:D-beta-hydroxybutyrate dehydrogenase, mitochondrial-like n=1 Tax=Eriocheir sinensis TaxID=95602 RepID=UPI0021C7C4AD|nr:D-beta-hydroxybutyrate dehydrogenase, mitochondrial-like [Eriocheir sinensis]
MCGGAPWLHGETACCWVVRFTVCRRAVAKMAWNFDRTGEVLLWAGVSGIVAMVLNTFGCSFSCYWVFLGCWMLSAGTVITLSYIKVKPTGKAVIVTGCDHGIGNALAVHLHEQGFLVFAGCLNPHGEGAEALRGLHSQRLIVLSMDVTRQDQLDKAAQEVKRLLPQDEVVWGLVNNAGVTARAHTEWVPLSTYRRVVDINLLGVIAATKAFLPLIRRGRGRVVNMSSVSGMMGAAMMSPYAATKYAVEGFSDCLRQEMKPWGVAVSLVEPANFNAATRLVTEEGVAEEAELMWATMEEVVRADYGKEYFDYVMKILQQTAFGGERDVTPVLTAVTEALTQRFPRARYRVVNTYYFFKVAAAIHLPEWLCDRLPVPVAATVPAAMATPSSLSPVPTALRYTKQKKN